MSGEVATGRVAGRWSARGFTMIELVAVVGGREEFDDADDYGGWVAGPPRRLDGMVIPDASEYERAVVVEWVASNDVTDVRVRRANQGALGGATRWPS